MGDRRAAALQAQTKEQEARLAIAATTGDNICRSFAKTGNCTRTGCKFIHTKDDEKVEKTTGPCFTFQKTGACKYGDDCKYHHTAAASTDKECLTGNYCYEHCSHEVCVYSG